MHTFLIVQEAVEQSFASKLADQAFTVVLLLVIAVILVRRVKQVEDKLEKYMSEDREEMQEVIRNNTRAFERIAGKIPLLLLVLLLSASSCLTRKATTESLVKSDSITLKETSRSSAFSASIQQTIIRDTAVAIGEREATDSMCLADLQPLFTATGQAVPNVKTFSANGVTGTVTTTPDNKVIVKCKADFLTIVIRGLTIQRDSLLFSVDSFTDLQKAFAASARYSKETEKTSSGLSWIDWAIIVLFGAAVLYLAIKRPKL